MQKKKLFRFVRAAREKIRLRQRIKNLKKIKIRSRFKNLKKLKFKRLQNLSKNKFSKRFRRLIFFLLISCIIVVVGSKILTIKVVKCPAWGGVYSTISDNLPSKFFVDRTDAITDFLKKNQPVNLQEVEFPPTLKVSKPLGVGRCLYPSGDENTRWRTRKISLDYIQRHFVDERGTFYGDMI